MTRSLTLAPVDMQLTLNCTASHAFAAYTRDIAKWWPTAEHSVSGERTATVVFEARVGGRIYEVDLDGQDHLWGTVEACEDGKLLRHTWHPGRNPADGTTQVEIRFVDLGATCRFELSHSGFEIYAERGEAIRDNYVSGWQFVAGEAFKNLAEKQKTP